VRHSRCPDGAGGRCSAFRIRAGRGGGAPGSRSRSGRGVRGGRSGSSTGAGTDRFTYDNAGNAATRTINGVNQTYTFNSENQFAQAVIHNPSSDDVTRHLYDAAGGLLIRRDPGATTLYAAGQEFRLAAGTVTSTRYYSHNGSTVAARTTAGLTWLASDHQGSATIALTPATNQIQKRWYTPYGADRATTTPDGTPTTWPTDRGFLNKQTNTSTALIDMCQSPESVEGSVMRPRACGPRPSVVRSR
jgi:hypothetical protein